MAISGVNQQMKVFSLSLLSLSVNIFLSDKKIKVPEYLFLVVEEKVECWNTQEAVFLKKLKT